MRSPERLSAFQIEGDVVSVLVRHRDRETTQTIERLADAITRKPRHHCEHTDAAERIDHGEDQSEAQVTIAVEHDSDVAPKLHLLLDRNSERS